METNKECVWYKKEIIKCNFNIKKVILYFMMIAYPLIVIPNKYGYFYFPRYIIIVVFSVFCLPGLFKSKNKHFLLAYTPLILFIVLVFISTIVATNSETAWIGLFGDKILLRSVNSIETSILSTSTARFTGYSTILCCIIMYLTAYKTDKSDKLIDCMIICASIVGFTALLQHFGLNIVPHEVCRDNYPPYGTIGQPNFLATYTVFILPAAIYNFLKSRNKLWLPCVAIIYSGLLVSTTRGAWIALGISMIIMCLYYLRQKRFRKSFIVVIAIMAITTLVLLLTKDKLLLKRMLSIPTNISSGLELEDNAGSGRLSIWKQVVMLIPDNWAFGVGPDNLIYSGIWLAPNTVVDKAHNIYLETAVTMGIPALICYLAFLSFFLRPWKTDRGFMFFSMISTYMIQGFFNIDVIMVLPLFWIILGFSQANMEVEKLAEGT